MRKITTGAALLAALAILTGCTTATTTTAKAPAVVTAPTKAPIPNCDGRTLTTDATAPSGYRCATDSETAAEQTAADKAAKAADKAAKVAASTPTYSSDIHNVGAYKIIGKASYTCGYGYGTFTMRIRNMSGQFVGAVIFDLTLMGKSGGIVWNESGSLNNLAAGATKTLTIMGQGCPSYSDLAFDVSMAY